MQKKTIISTVQQSLIKQNTTSAIISGAFSLENLSTGTGKGTEQAKSPLPSQVLEAMPFSPKSILLLDIFTDTDPAVLTQQDSIADPMKIVRRIFFFTPSRKIIFSSLIPLDKAGGIHYYFSNF